MSRERRVSLTDQLAADTIHVPCPDCGAEVDVPCKRAGRTARTPCLRRITAACPLVADHTPGPPDYPGFHAWAERMTRTHRQATCDGCGGWLIWIPKEQP